MQKLLTALTPQPTLVATRSTTQFTMYRLCLLILLLGAAQYAHAEGGKILKWKDEHGVTHYGDNIPSQYNNRESSQINRQGITVKHNVPSSNNNADELNQLALAKAEQTKRDKALLGAFSNVDEIDLALERNIQLDKIALDNLQQERATRQKSLDSKKAMAASFEQRKKVVPNNLKADIADEQANISRVDKNITERSAAINQTQQRFEEDKKRYTLLKSGAVRQ